MQRAAFLCLRQNFSSPVPALKGTARQRRGGGKAPTTARLGGAQGEQDEIDGERREKTAGAPTRGRRDEGEDVGETRHRRGDGRPPGGG